jgi:hypothetical protein
MINLFVDDIREPTDIYIDQGQWIIARTSKAAIEILESCVEIFTISLDHDLGGNDTIEPVLTKLQEMAFNGITCPVVQAHSSNPVGVQKIRAVAEFVERYR